MPRRLMPTPDEAVTPPLTEAEWAARIDAWLLGRQCSTWGRSVDVLDDEDRAVLVGHLATLVMGAAAEPMA